MKQKNNTFVRTRPCDNCPFKVGQGEKFCLGTERVLEILNATAFQCHKTVDYSQWDDPRGRQGPNPQQCAGVMSLLHRAKMPNQIMQIGERLGMFDPSKLDHSQVYRTVQDAIEAHSWLEDNYAPEPAHEERHFISGEPTRGRMIDFVRAWERSRYSGRIEGPL
jgi:hypothetical protein